MTQSYSLEEICGLAEISKRTARYYMQIGLVDRPIGETRAARYGAKQLDQLIRVKQLSEAGISLERIGEVMRGDPPPLPARPRRPGDIQVRSQVFIAPGIELHIDSETAGLSPEALREFIKRIVNQWEAMHGE